ncbi:MAG: hypothetical protein CL908_23130 [Deltaproteobacteria bacterium]|nr:hypothetical protein [Deltaproteobacteria bacterium]
MATTEAVRTINCPKCSASYKLRADYQGNVKCKKCERAFSVGVTHAERRGQHSRDSNDHKTAIKLTVICSVALLLIAGIVYLAGSSDSGVTAGNRSAKGRRRNAALPKSYAETHLRANVPTSQHPPRIADRFLRAMADGDKDGLSELFLFDHYFEWADKHYGNLDENKNGLYAVGTAEYQASQRELVLDQLMDAGRSEFLRRDLVPQIDSNEEWVWARKRVEPDYADIQFLCKDSAGQDLFIIYIGVRLKKGMTPQDGGREDAWGVYKVSDQWYQKTLAIAKPEKRLVDIGVGRHYKDVMKARKAAGAGPAEAKAEFQDPVPGTSAGQKDAIEAAVRVLLDEGSSGPDYFRSQAQLKDMGKGAIPFLLNVLLDKDHREDEQDIMTAHKATVILREITGKHFGYAPGKAKMAMQSLATATADERDTAVRRWFGWWKLNKRSWKGRVDEDEEGEEDK